MGFNIKNNYGPNIEVNAGGKVTLVQGRNGLWHIADAEDVRKSRSMGNPSLLWKMPTGRFRKRKPRGMMLMWWRNSNLSFTTTKQM